VTIQFSQEEQSFIVGDFATDLLLTRAGLKLVDKPPGKDGFIAIDVSPGEHEEFLTELREEFIRKSCRIKNPSFLIALARPGVSSYECLLIHCPSPPEMPQDVHVGHPSPEGFQVCPPVVIIQENGLMPMTTINHLINCSRIFQSHVACHLRIVDRGPRLANNKNRPPWVDIGDTRHSHSTKPLWKTGIDIFVCGSRRLAFSSPRLGHARRHYKWAWHALISPRPWP
jgi:hypothetical protein